MGLDFSPRVKQPGNEPDHSSPAIAEVKNTWIYASTPPYAFMTLFYYYNTRKEYTV
jgi:hypothetical protein